MLKLRELRRVVAILDRELRGTRPLRARVAGLGDLLLTLRDGAGQRRQLLVSAEPGRGRIGLVDGPPPPRGSAVHPFAALVRARLAPTRLERAGLRGADRLAALDFEAAADRFTLLLALMGPRSNVYLLDAADRVLGALRPPAKTRSDLVVGATWSPPPSSPPSEGEDRFAGCGDEALCAAIETHYRIQAAGQERRELAQRLERALGRARRALDRQAEAVAADAGGGEEAAALRRCGELLKGALASLRPGQRESRLRDYETGREIDIELDPALSPGDQMRDFFRRARKAERRAARAVVAAAELEERDRALTALEARYAAVAEGEDAADDLGRLAAEAPVQHLLRRYAPPKPAASGVPAPAGRGGSRGRASHPFRVGRRELPRRLWPRRYRSSDGLEIWVGRSDEGNDLLSTRLARGKDLFLHLDTGPSSHVVLRCGGRPDPPSESLLEASELAVHFSKQRATRRATVLVAPIASVRKPRGAKPGLVTVQGGRTLVLRRDPARLARILAARIEEEEG